MDEAAAPVNHIWNVAVALVCIRLDQGFREAADYLVGSSRSSRKAPMQYFRIGPTPWLITEPAGVGFDWRAAVA